MGVVGSVASLWRYPVKSMRGEQLTQAFVGFAGVYGDRLFAFTSPARPKGFPYLTGRERREMILYQPRFRHPERSGAPPNLAEAEAMPPGVTPTVADPEDLALDIDTGSGEPGFSEDAYLKKKLRIGSKLILTVVARDPCCAMISLDPDTAEPDPAVLRQVAQEHEGDAGVYGAVLVEGTVRPGDKIELLD